MEVVKNENANETEPVEVAAEKVVSEATETTEHSEAVAVDTPDVEPVYADCILYNRNEILEVIGLLDNMEIRGVQNATVVARINEILDTHGSAVKVPVQTSGMVSPA